MINRWIYELPPVSVGILEVMTVGSLLGDHPRIMKTPQVGFDVIAVEDHVHGVPIFVDRPGRATPELELQAIEI